MKAASGTDSDTLARLPNLASLSRTQLETLSASMSVAEFRRRQKIFDQNQSASQVYLVISGLARMVLQNREDRKVLVNMLSPGRFFGIGALFPEKRHPFSAEAFTDCSIGIIDANRLIEILLGIPFHIYLRYSDVLMGQVWRMYLHCVEGIGLTLRKRLALELLELAASFGIRSARGTLLSPSPTHQDLADSIGASRQKVGECLAFFEARMAIRKDSRALIVYPRQLREIVDKS
jgi:CRP/FNR family transcriptional regulator, cyclic AMP receptor protein